MCKHHWIIKGYEGTCKLCGIVRTFPIEPAAKQFTPMMPKAQLRDYVARMRNAYVTAKGG